MVGGLTERGGGGGGGGGSYCLFSFVLFFLHLSFLLLLFLLPVLLPGSRQARRLAFLIRAGELTGQLCLGQGLELLGKVGGWVIRVGGDAMCVCRCVAPT